MKKEINQGITLLSLVITIIVLLILVAISIVTLTGENGILGKGETAKQETNEKTATEMINLKITNAQIKSYSETQEMPSLQYLADRLCEDDEIEYVELETQKIAKLKDIIVPQGKNIFTKLKEYPYEFEIDGELKLASINGIKIANNNTVNEELIAQINSLETQMQDLKTQVNQLENKEEKLNRTKLLNSPYEFTMNTVGTWIEGNNGDITLLDSVENYKYLIFHYDTINHSGGRGYETTTIVPLEELSYNNSNTVEWQNNSTFYINVGGGQHYKGAVLWLKNNKTVHIGAKWNSQTEVEKFVIRNIYGIK